MEFRVLGPLAVTAGSEEIRLGGHKEQVVLCALVVAAGQVVSVDRLADVLWGDEAPSTALKTLRSYVSRLRNRLREWGEPVVTVSGGYLLDPSEHQIDALAFERLLHEARAQRDHGAHAGAVARLDEALGLWRGRALMGFEDHEFARLEAARLEAMRWEAIEARLDSHLALGHHDRLIAEIEPLVEEHPLREGLWQALMLGLYRAGRQAEALRAFQRARTMLGEELGIEPSPALRELEEAILLQADRLAVSQVADRYELVPEARTSFVGREAEIEELVDLLRRERCVTVTGVGGSGKTRLSTEAARRLIGEYDSGVVFVGLASVLDPDRVPEHVGSVLGDVGSHAEDILEALVGFLGPRELMLVIDNCEHVIRAVAELVDALLAGCPSLTVLATSREPLRTQGEAIFRVPPLELPDPEAEPHVQDDAAAVRLYVDRVRAFDRSFRVDDSIRPAVVSICRALDGIPLAIELAAARARAMSPVEMAARMDDRFTILSTGSRTAPARHQTLRAAIEWSYELCRPHEREVLRRLSVFAAGWSLDAAEAVVGGEQGSGVAIAVAGLADRSLVELTGSAAEPRYRLLETIRQFAFDELVKAGEAPEVAARHCDRYLDLAELARPELKGPDQVEWLRRLDAEHDDLRAAIGWSLALEDPTRGFRLVAALGWYWFMRGNWQEAWRWTRRCLDRGDDVDPLEWAHVVLSTGTIEIIRGKLDPVTGLLDRCLEVCRTAGDEDSEAWALHYKGHAAGWRSEADASDLMLQGLELFEQRDDPWAVAWSWRYLGQEAHDVEEQVELQRRSLDRFVALGDRWSAAYSLYLLGNTYIQAGRYDEAEDVERQALDIASELEDVIWSTHALGRLGIAAHLKGDSAAAMAILTEGIDRHRRIGDENCTAILLGYRGMAEGNLGQWEDAVASTADSLQIWKRLGNRMLLALYMVRFAFALAGRGDPHEAAILHGAFLAAELPEVMLGRAPFAGEIEDLEDRLRSTLGDEYEVLVQRGAGLSLDEAYERALAHTARGS